MTALLCCDTHFLAKFKIKMIHFIEKSVSFLYNKTITFVNYKCIILTHNSSSYDRVFLEEIEL